MDSDLAANLHADAAVDQDQDYPGLARGGESAQLEPELDPVSADLSEEGHGSSACPRCGAGEETTFHQLWECPCDRSIEWGKFRAPPGSARALDHSALLLA